VKDSFDQFLRQLKEMQRLENADSQTGSTIDQFDFINSKPRRELEYDSVFHLPLLAMTVLALLTERRYPLTVGDSGRYVGLVIEKAISGYLRSAQMLGASATLRIRTNEAVVALEDLGLIRVSDQERSIALTIQGRAFIRDILNEQSSLGLATRSLVRHYRHLRNDLGGQL
jgi:hypothetical protein